MPAIHCKRIEFAALARPLRRWTIGLCLGLVLGLVSCSGGGGHVRLLRVDQLEDAPEVQARPVGRAIVLNPPALGSLYSALCKRLGLIEIREPKQWELLKRVAPALGKCPDLTKGIVIGVLSCAGLPLNGDWPIRVGGIRVFEGAGLVAANFHSGTYLPDTTTFIDLVHVPGLRSVLVLEVNGVRFYPGEQD